MDEYQLKLFEELVEFLQLEVTLGDITGAPVTYIPGKALTV